MLRLHLDSEQFFFFEAFHFNITKKHPTHLPHLSLVYHFGSPPRDFNLPYPPPPADSSFFSSYLSLADYLPDHLSLHLPDLNFFSFSQA